MKKLVFMFVAVAAVSLASCGGNKQADAEKAAADSVRIADSIAAVEAAAEEAAAALTDSVEVAVEEVAVAE